MDNGVSIDLLNPLYSNFQHPQSIIIYQTFIPLVLYKYNKPGYISSLELGYVDTKTQKFVIRKKPNWTIQKIFWVLNYNLMPPIPKGTTPYVIRNNNNFPYGVSYDFREDTDPFWIERPTVTTEGTDYRFLTFNRPVPNTIPLYIFDGDSIGNNQAIYVSPTKENLPKSITNNELDVSPIFVYTKTYNNWRAGDSRGLPNSKFYNETICYPVEKNEGQFSTLRDCQNSQQSTNDPRIQLKNFNETLNQKTPKTQLDSNSNSKYAATIAILCLVSLIGIFLIYSLFFI